MSQPAVQRPSQRWLVYELLRRELVQRYGGSVSGIAWTFLQPLAQLALFAFIFSQVFRATVPPEYPGVTYIGFVAVAIWPWTLFSESILRGMAAITANGGVIRKVALPSEVFVYAAVGACCVVHVAGFVVVLLVLRACGEGIHLAAIPFAIALLVPYALLAAGIALVLAALQTLVKDVEYGTGIVLSLIFYATPILYPMSLVPERWREALLWSPLAWLTSRIRDVLIGTPSFQATDLAVLVACALVFAGGLWVFRRLAPYFEDFL